MLKRGLGKMKGKLSLPWEFSDFYLGKLELQLEYGTVSAGRQFGAEL